MSFTTITITKLNGTNDAEWATKMALGLEQKKVCSIIEGCSGKPAEHLANTSTTEKATFTYWMNCQGVT
jgi:hypothetical protein